MLCLLSLQIQAQNISFTHSKGKTFLTKGAFYLTDSTGQLKIGSIKKDTVNFQSFIPPLNLGITDNVTWLRFKVKNPTEDNQQLRLTFQDKTIYTLDFYLYDSSGRLLSKQKSGWFYPPKVRHYAPLIFFDFHLAPAQEAQVYIRVYSKTFIAINPYLSTSAYGEAEVINPRLHASGLFYGLMAMILFFNFSFYLATRRRSFLYFSSYSLFFLLICSLLDGSLGIYFYFLVSFFAGRQDVYIMLGGEFFLILFIDHSFQLHKHHKWFKYIFWSLNLLGLLLAFSNFLLPAFTLYATVFLVLIGPLLVLSVGLYTFFFVEKRNAWVLISFLPLLMGMFLGVWDLVQTSQVSNYLFKIVYLVHVLLLSGTLIARMRKIFNLYINQEREKQRITQQKNEELEQQVIERTKQLAKQEANLQALVDSNLQSVYSLDQDLRVMTINYNAQKSAKEVYQTTIEVGDILTEQFPAKFNNLMLPLIKRALEGEKVTSIDHKIRPGHIIKHILSPIRDNEQSIVGVSIYSRDISKQLRNEQNLKYNQNLLQSIMDGSNNAVFLLDEQQTHILITNRRAEVLFQQGVKKLVGQHPEVVLFEPQKMQDIFTIGKYEMKFKVEEGKYFWGELYVYTFKADAETYWVWRIIDISKQRVYEQKIRDQTLRLRSILDNNNDAIWLIDSQYRLLEFNKVFAEGFRMYYGFMPQNGYSVIDEMTNEAYKLTWRNRYWQVFHYGKVAVYEYEQMYEGEHIYISTTIFPIYHEGRIVSVAAFSKNITPQKHNENLLKNLNARFLGVLESSQDMVFATDANYRFIFFNQRYKKAFEKLYDKPLEVGLSIQEVIKNPEHYTTFKAYVKRGLLGETFQVEHLINYRVVEASFNPIRNHLSEVTGVSIFVRDITHKQEAELAIRKSQQLLTSISRNIKEAIYRSTPEGALIYANHAFLEIFGFASLEDAQNRKGSLFCGTPEHREKLINKLNQQGYYNNEELQLRRKDGTVFWGLVTSSRLLEDDGQVFFDGAIRDITETKKLAQQLKSQNEALSKTNRELDRFVYSASHDLRAPLTSILGLVDLIKSEEDENEKEQYLDLVLMSVKRLDDFIQQIIQYSRNARLEMDIEEIDFEQLIKETLTQLQYGENQGKISIDAEIDVKKTFYNDAFRLQIVLNNLVSNALRYHNPYQEQPFIKISVHNHSKGVILMVEDNGQGIAEKHQERIFDMFYKANSSRKGSGLGLYIVKETIEMLGGTIKIHSHFGKGSRFEVYLTNLRSKLYDAT